MDKSHKFELVSSYKPTGDQPQAISKLVEGLNQNKKLQVLLGATGTGKTFTYIKSMYELNKEYGWSKFIVMVPSIIVFMICSKQIMGNNVSVGVKG